MRYVLEAIYNSEDAETLDLVQEFQADLEDIQEQHMDVIDVFKYDIYDIDEEERESLEDRFGEDLTVPMVILQDQIIFTDYPSKDEIQEAVESTLEEAEMASEFLPDLEPPLA